MLKGRSFVYYPKRKFIKVTGLPPKGWEELTNAEQFKEFNTLAGFEMEITASQFDY